MSEPGDPNDPEYRRDHLKRAFREGAIRYEALRPGYPVDSIRWLVGESPSTVADIGAGTGKLTEVLVGLGHRVIAVEPSMDMMHVLMTRMPTVRALLGSGERTGIEDHSVDAITYGQSWQWVHRERGAAEAARILRPGGRLGLVWNSLDTRTGWVADFHRVLHSLDQFHVVDAGTHDDLARVGAPFRSDGERRERHTVATTTAQLALLVTTRSYYLALPHPGRVDLVRRMTAWVEGRFGAADDTPVEVPYVTESFRFVLADDR